MRWLVVTPPDFVPGEAAFINKLFLHGVDLLHFRKPEASIGECRRLLREIPARWHERIVLHDNFSLLGEFGLHGVHLNRRNPMPPVGFLGSVSCSCHSLEEVKVSKGHRDYVFLSPIFDSISKQGYGSAFSPEMLTQAAGAGIVDESVYALGGMDVSRLSLVRSWHFGGAVFLGDIWSKKDLPGVENYLDEIKMLV